MWPKLIERLKANRALSSVAFESQKTPLRSDATHRNRRQSPAKKVLKLLCLLYSVSGSKWRLPNTFVMDGYHRYQLETRDFDERLQVLRLIVDLHADDGVDEEEHGDE